MDATTEKIAYLERWIDILLAELIDDDKLRATVALIVKTPRRKPTAKEIEWGKSLAPRVAKMLEAK